MLDRLVIRDFRCFQKAELRLDAQTTLLLGRNGQGKTSLMEAACVLLRLQSPRTSVRQELIRLGAETAMVEGEVDGRALRCVMSPTNRRMAVEGATCPRMVDYLSQSGLVVWMDHADMGLLRGGADQRRRFLDFAASQMVPGYLKALRGYERALRGRNFVLKRDASIRWPEAEAFAGVMEEHARVLIQARSELCQAMTGRVTEAHGVLSRGEEQVEIRYLPSCQSGDLREALGSRRAEESRLRTTVAGPHRDDLGLTLGGMNACSFASEGQQRTLALSMKLAQAHALKAAKGRAPLMLIDDVFGELDPFRRRALMGYLPSDAQKIITTTQVDWLEEEPFLGSRYRVEQGCVEHLSNVC